jgi:hypothetical protein
VATRIHAGAPERAGRERGLPRCSPAKSSQCLKLCRPGRCPKRTETAPVDACWGFSGGFSAIRAAKRGERGPKLSPGVRRCSPQSDELLGVYLWVDNDFISDKPYISGYYCPIMAEEAPPNTQRFYRFQGLPACYPSLCRVLTWGVLGEVNRTRCRQLLGVPPAAAAPAPPTNYRERYRQLTGFSLEICPDCGGQMELLGPLPYLGSRKTSARYDTS